MLEMPAVFHFQWVTTSQKLTHSTHKSREIAALSENRESSSIPSYRELVFIALVFSSLMSLVEDDLVQQRLNARPVLLKPLDHDHFPATRVSVEPDAQPISGEYRDRHELLMDDPRAVGAREVDPGRRIYPIESLDPAMDAIALLRE